MGDNDTTTPPPPPQPDTLVNLDNPRPSNRMMGEDYEWELFADYEGEDNIEEDAFASSDPDATDAHRKLLELDPKDLYSSTDPASSAGADEPHEEHGRKLDAPEGEEPKCVTALGMFKLKVDAETEKQEGGMEGLYNKASAATLRSVNDGTLSKNLDQKQARDEKTWFEIEGPGVVADEEFDPYAEEFVEDAVEVEADEKKMQTLDIVLISLGAGLIFCLCCVLCFVELERKTRPKQTAHF